MTTPPDKAVDLRWMRAALALGRRGLGATGSNPAVGAVLIDFRDRPEGRLIGQGWTQAGGRPHAEAMALAMARETAPDAIAGATAYVTLEPCAHHGKTPPCADALVAAGVARVVFAHGDPDPRVAGRGKARLAAGGVVVEAGLAAESVAEDLAGYLLRQTQGRPAVTLKLAATLDGRIATASGESRWITGPAARARAHLLRAEADAILVGVGTVLADDPGLDVRLPGLEDRSPIRIVADSRLRTPVDCGLVRSAVRRPLWILHGPDASPDAAAALTGAGAELIETPLAAIGEGLDIAAGLQALGARGVSNVFCEGGGRLAAGLMAADRVDRLIWVSAGLTIGADGRPAVGPLSLAALADAPRYALHRQERVGDDIWTEWRRAAARN